MDPVSRLDLAFCVDLTGSMAGFIAAARAHLIGILEALRAELGQGLRVAIAGYRDHCDGPRLLEVLPLGEDLQRARATLDAFQVNGGGDAPEAVFSGLDACLRLGWEPGAYRVVVLVGDAPPHACGAPGDAHPAADPSGWALDDMANRLEADGVFVHALSMTPGDPVLQRAWKRLALGSGGVHHDATSPGAAVEIVQAISRRCLTHMAFDRRLLEALRADAATPVELLARQLSADPAEVSAGLMRLRQRGLVGGSV